jgi:hypothetical protein
MLSDKTMAYGEQVTTALLGVDALYRAESGDEEGLVVVNMATSTHQPEDFESYVAARDRFEQLSAQAADLPEPDRCRYYEQLCQSTLAFMDWRQGDLPLSDQLNGFLHVPAEPASDAELDALRGEMRSLLNSMCYDGDLVSQSAAWETRNRVPPDEVSGVIDELMAEAWDRTDERLPIPATKSDAMRVVPVSGVAFNARCNYLERKIERLGSALKGDKKLLPVLDAAHKLQAHLQAGMPVTSYPDQDNEIIQSLVQEMRFLTSKPVIYAANVDETGFNPDNPYLRAVEQVAARQGAEMVVLSARLEADMLEMSEDEKQEFMELVGAECCGLDQVIQKSFQALDLISFFTKNENEVRVWTVRRGTTAPRAAGAIHTDFERGFIRAEVIPFDTFARYGSDAAVKAAGQMRLEGKEYIVHDGDVIFFRFNV